MGKESLKKDMKKQFYISICYARINPYILTDGVG